MPGVGETKIYPTFAENAYICLIKSKLILGKNVLQIFAFFFEITFNHIFNQNIFSPT